MSYSVCMIQQPQDVICGVGILYRRAQDATGMLQIGLCLDC